MVPKNHPSWRLRSRPSFAAVLAGLFTLLTIAGCDSTESDRDAATEHDAGGADAALVDAPAGGGDAGTGGDASIVADASTGDDASPRDGGSPDIAAACAAVCESYVTCLGLPPGDVEQCISECSPALLDCDAAGVGAVASCADSTCDTLQACMDAIPCADK